MARMAHNLVCNNYTVHKTITTKYLKVFLHFYAAPVVFRHCMQTHGEVLAFSVQGLRILHRVPGDKRPWHWSELWMCWQAGGRPCSDAGLHAVILSLHSAAGRPSCCRDRVSRRSTDGSVLQSSRRTLATTEPATELVMLTSQVEPAANYQTESL